MPDIKYVHSQSQYEALLEKYKDDPYNVFIKAERMRDGTICVEFGTHEEREALREQFKNKKQ